MSDTPGICIHEEAGWQPPNPLRAELLAAGARAAATHTWDAVAERTLAAYESLAARPRRRLPPDGGSGRIAPGTRHGCAGHHPRTYRKVTPS